MTGNDKQVVDQLKNKLQTLSSDKKQDPGKPQIIRDKKGRIIKGVAQDTNKNGTAGAPTKYDPKYCKMLIDFFNIPLTREKEIKHYRWIKEAEHQVYTHSTFEEVPNEFPTYVQFAMKIGVDWDTLKEWRKVHPDFSASWAKAKKIQESNWMRGTMKGQYNAQFAMFIGKNIYGYRDKQETDIKSDGKEIKGLTVGIVSYKDVKK